MTQLGDQKKRKTAHPSYYNWLKTADPSYYNWLESSLKDKPGLVSESNGQLTDQAFSWAQFLLLSDPPSPFLSSQYLFLASLPEIDT